MDKSKFKSTSLIIIALLFVVILLHSMKQEYIIQYSIDNDLKTEIYSNINGYNSRIDYLEKNNITVVK